MTGAHDPTAVVTPPMHTTGPAVRIGSIRASWQRGDSVRGVWASAGSGVVAEVLAGCGFDYVVLDLQHGAFSVADLAPALRLVHAAGSLPLVRVADNDPATIGRVLDDGAMGVIVPSVNSAAEAARAVAACRYPPRGSRSYGPLHAASVLGSVDPRVLDDVICAVMIETASGLDEVEAIAAVPGVDVLYLGPVDLALSLGLSPTYESASPAHQGALIRVLDACSENDVVPGIQCDGGAMARRRVESGFRMVTVTTDLQLLRCGAQSV